MAENNGKKDKKKESYSKRTRKAYRQGYVAGFDDRSRLGDGSRFWGTAGYSRGFGDRKKIDKINRRVNRYRAEK